MPPSEKPIEFELLESATCVDLHVLKTEKEPTTAPDWHIRIEGRIGDEEEDDVEFAGLGLIYALGVLSFADARPRGVSDRDFEESDDWTAADMLRHLRFVRGELHFDADYVRGRCVKTRITVRQDGTFTLETTNRGEAATRWIPRLQGKKPLAAVPSEPDAD